MLTYQVEPGKSVGIFHLGDSLWRILDELRTRKTEYPKVEVAYDPNNATRTAVTLHLSHLSLYFPHSPHQTLQRIVFPSLPSANVDLIYESHELHIAGRPLSKTKVSQLFGPTYAAGNGAKLAYPGISFDLMVASGRVGTISQLSVMPLKESEPPLLSPLNLCVIQPGRGVVLHMPDPMEIIIGETTSQDLLLDLGAPLRKHWKEDDRMERMWGLAGSKVSENSCFWNYFQYGLDFLISPDGLVEKVICHSNIPGTPLFQRYARCPWILPHSNEPALPPRDFSSPASSYNELLGEAPYPPSTHLAVPQSRVISRAGSPGKTANGKKKRGGSPASVSADGSDGGKETQTVPIARAADRSEAAALSQTEDAMVLDRSVEGGLEGISNLSPSHLIGFEGMIIEEDQQSGGITSVLVFRDGA